jgi:hypothetical protein
MFDDPDFTSTYNYTTSVEFLRLLSNNLFRFLEAWENFESGELYCFFMEEDKTLRERWEEHIANIHEDVYYLRSLRTMLNQRIETFENRRTIVSQFLYYTKSVSQPFFDWLRTLCIQLYHWKQSKQCLKTCQSFGFSL